MQELLKQRQQHADALTKIDRMLSQIGGLLSGDGASAPASSAKSAFAARPAASFKPARPGTRRRFAVSGEQSVIDFVKRRNGATTSEIQANWRSQGRGGNADNSISKLVKEKRLRRIPLVGQRGSRYTAI